MAVDMFLKIDGIDGESTDKSHKGEIDILSFSWGVHNASGGATGGGGGAGKATAEDFQFKHLVDKASPLLMLNCANGKHIQNAQFTVRKGGGDKGEYLKIKLTDCLVSSVAPGFDKPLDGDFPVETFTLNFAKFHIEEIPSDGTPTVVADIDFTGNT
jgi:type VI secretion system secreted protein Hcp